MEQQCQDGQGHPCPRPATVRLYPPATGRYRNPDKPVPGPGMCAEHAQEVIAEYRDKLQEQWIARPIR